MAKDDYQRDYVYMKQQRDELLAAAKNLRDVKGRHHSEIAMNRLIEAIAKAEQIMSHNLEDLLDEIQEDEVVDILLDTNELGAFLHAIAANYDDSATADVFSFLRALQIKSNQIREKLVLKKYPLMSNDPRD